MADQDKKSQASQQDNAKTVTNPSENDPIKKLRKDLQEIDAVFRDRPNSWINGTAIGFLPSASDKQAGKADLAPTTPRILIFVDPSAPECERANIKERVQNRADVLRVSRFIGLQTAPLPSPGNSASTFAPFRYNLPPVNAGTFGARVVAEPQGLEFVLSSNHVFAHNGRAAEGTPITVPGPVDDLTAGPVIATRSYFVSMKDATWPYVWPSQGPPNLVDCALAAKNPAVAVSAGSQVDLVRGIALLSTSELAAISQATINKTGRATGLTSSSIRLFGLRGYIGFTFGTCYFEGLIGTFDQAFGLPGSASPIIFAAPGDSGSVAVIDGSATTQFRGRAIGLVTARAYVFDDSDRFVAYIIALCPMEAVETGLMDQMNLNLQTKVNNLTFFV